jgi:hypothetical protein
VSVTRPSVATITDSLANHATPPATSKNPDARFQRSIGGGYPTGGVPLRVLDRRVYGVAIRRDL